jgi:fermentation-respiration switch protein FrsA (DUF1100 family)
MPKLSLTTRFDSLEKIKSYRGPLLLAHGEADEVVPYEHGLELYAAAAGPKKLFTNPGGKHNDPQPEEYRVALDQFLKELPPLGSAVRTASVDVRVEPLGP